VVTRTGDQTITGIKTFDPKLISGEIESAGDITLDTDTVDVSVKDIVTMTGDQTVTGIKTFQTKIITPEIESDGDITLDSGANKTAVFDPVVYDDFVPAVTVLATGSASPDVVNHTIQGVLGSYYGFDGGSTEERLTIKIELYHGYKVGSNIEIHVHAMPSTNNSGEVVWHFDYFYSRINAAPEAGSVAFSKQFTVAANKQYNDYTVAIGTISGAPGGTPLNIGDFIIGTLRRTPTAPDTYPDDMLLKQIAAHCQLDTLGSRQMYIK
jgi:hypothetical protein